MKKFSGQALVEAVVAFAIVMVVLVALLQLSGRSISNSGESSRQAVATNYATEGLQWVKNQRLNLIWNDFEAKCGTIPCTASNLCLNVLSWAADCVTDPQISGTEYDRRLELVGAMVGVAPNTRAQLTATVTVRWIEAGRTVTAKQTSVFVER